MLGTEYMPTEACTPFGGFLHSVGTLAAGYGVCASPAMNRVFKGLLDALLPGLK